MSSLRTKSIQAYRQLYRAAGQCGLSDPSSLQRYLSHRFQSVAETHYRRLATALRQLASEMNTSQSQQTHAGDMGESFVESSSTTTSSSGSARHRYRHRRQRLLRTYERFVSRRIDDAHHLAQLLPRSAERSDLAALLQALAGGVGNTAYRRALEQGFSSLVTFAAQREARDEATEEATSERQNRIMQHAVLPYCERLLLLHRTAIGAHNQSSRLLYLTPWQVTEAVVGTRSAVVAHMMRHGHEHVMVEVDEGLNKQVIYVCRCRGEDRDSGSYEWQQPVERVEVGESEEVPRTIFHAEFLHTATRLCDALMHETRIHRSRKTVLIGHAVGGAVAVIMSLLLLQRGFSVANVITLGAPKALQSTQSRFVAAVNPVRLVLSGDPLIELPVTGSEGEPLTHIGEILLLTPHRAPRASSTSPEHTHECAGHDDTHTEDTYDATRRGNCDEGDVHTGQAKVHRYCPEGSTLSAGNAQPEAARVCRVEEEHEEADEDDEEDWSTLFREAEERYRCQFLVEDYVRHLADPTVELTYAEGDEVWDEGDYHASRRAEAAAATAPSATDEQRRRDMNGPL